VERLTDALDWFTHGWHAFVGAWLVVIVGTWAGLWLRGANKTRFLTAPIAAAVVAVLAMLAAAALKTGLDAAGIAGRCALMALSRSSRRSACSPACFIEGLHPQSLRRQEYRFRESVQGGGAGVEPASEALPPGVEQRVDRVRGAAADRCADALDGGALAFTQKSIGGAVDVGGADAVRSGSRADRLRGSGGSPGRMHVSNET